MTPYEELKKKICQALPRLMDDVVGQRYQSNGFNFDAVSISKDTITFLDWHEKELRWYYLDIIKRMFQTLGIEPTLSDCIDLLRILHKLDINSYESDVLKICYMWNLSQPLLKDQSKELIEYLLKLK